MLYISFKIEICNVLSQCREQATMIFRKELEKKRKKMSDGADCQVDNVTNDLMDGLMGLKDDEGKELSDTEVLDNIVSLVIAGYESTSLAIMWALYYLAKYPIVLQKLRVSYQNFPLKFSSCFLSIEIDI